MVQAEIKNKIISVVNGDCRFDIVDKIRVFGSYQDGTATAESDLDLLVDFVPGSQVGLLTFSDLKAAFTDKLHVEVDLLTERSISNYFRDDILSRAELVYEK